VLFHCKPVNQQKNIDMCINFMGRTKTKPFLKRKKVPKLYFHFWPPKKCPPFFFLIHTWWCENITASPCVSIHVHVVYFVTYFQNKLLFIVLDMGMIPERNNHKCFFVVRHPVLVKIIGTSNSHVRNIQNILKCLTVDKGNNKININMFNWTNSFAFHFWY
jgi:hypothetical protein